jgi:hypothetical protein
VIRILSPVWDNLWDVVNLNKFKSKLTAVVSNEISTYSPNKGLSWATFAIFPKEGTKSGLVGTIKISSTPPIYCWKTVQNINPRGREHGASEPGVSAWRYDYTLVASKNTAP